MNAPQHHILVVDDLVDNRGLVLQLLEGAYRISQAADGIEALGCIARDRPDLVLLDLMMPKLDGFGVLESLSRSSGGFLPVIVMSAATEREARMRALRLGANEFIAKPIDGEELQLRINTLLALKASRDELGRYAFDLASEVQRRTHELQEALDSLRAAEQYKDEFLSVLSHELRTPLNFIMGFASILEDEVSGPLNALQKSQMGKILGGADRMLHLVDDLLDIARIQAGKTVLKLCEASYAPLLQGVAESLAVTAISKRVEIFVDVCVEGPVIADEDRVIQIVTNLLSNALKFAPPASRVTIRAFEQSGWLRTEVSDQGPGVPPEHTTRVFEKFQQLDMSSTREFGGTGLGLAISKALVEAHGGNIGVDSIPGEGATFWFTLPLPEALDAAQMPNEAHTVLAHVPQPVAEADSTR